MKRRFGFILLCGFMALECAAFPAFGRESSVMDVLKAGMAAAETAAEASSEEEALPGEEEEKEVPVYDQVDYDLTKFSETMVYGLLYDMAAAPDKYEGTVVKMKGIIEKRDSSEGDGKSFYCVAYDETNCCSIGLELMLFEGSKQPKANREMTAVGVFETFRDGGSNYCKLEKALVQ